MAAAMLTAPFESLLNRHLQASTPARGLLATLQGRSFALALRSESDKEAVSAFKKARKLVQEHQLHDLLQEQPVPAAARVGEAAARAAGAASGAADKVKKTASDPDVINAVREVGNAAKSIGDMIGAFTKAARKRT